MFVLPNVLRLKANINYICFFQPQQQPQPSPAPPAQQQQQQPGMLPALFGFQFGPGQGYVEALTPEQQHQVSWGW